MEKVSKQEFNEAVETCNSLLSSDKVEFVGDSFKVLRFNRNIMSYEDFGTVTKTDITLKYERSESDMLVFENLQMLLAYI